MFLLDPEVGEWKKGKWYDHRGEAGMADVLSKLSKAAGERAKERREARLRMYSEGWDFPESVGKEDHRDRFHRFSGK